MDVHANVLIIGVGNRLRGDDAAGPAVADRVRSRVPHTVRIIDHSGEGASLLATWRPADTVILIDAAHSGGNAGTMYEFDAHSHAMPAGFFNYSTHAFSVAEAIELARVLDRMPAQLLVFAIEGQDFAAGHALSPAVAAAVEVVADRIVARLEDCGMRGGVTGTPCTNSVS